MRNLIKKILKEENEWFNEFKLDLNDPRIWLAEKMLSCKLEKIGSKNWEGWTRYVDPEGKILFLDDIETGAKYPVLYYDRGKIYKKLEEFGLNSSEINNLCINTLYETHKRKVLTATISAMILAGPLYETHKRKVFTASLADCILLNQLV